MLLNLARPNDARELQEVETELVETLRHLGRQLIDYHLTSRHENSAELVDVFTAKGFCRRGTRSRSVKTTFGEVRFERAYLRQAGRTRGVFPLDLQLGLSSNCYTIPVVSTVALLSTLMSFDEAAHVTSSFLGWCPAKRSIEGAVLEFGKHTEDWFRQSEAPEDDGSVLVVQIDNKCAPTAKEQELEKRRKPRSQNANRIVNSRRHRGRQDRERLGPKPRRKKGDKSKNGKATTVVVMYTLESDTDAAGEPILKGPINQRVYASFRSKRHAFKFAQSEARKRGFDPASPENMIQVVTDGDECFEHLTEEFFPDAIHTLDVMHALSYLWKAGTALHTEGSDEMQEWYEAKKELLYDGSAEELIGELEEEHAGLPRTGPGTKGRRERLRKALAYLEKRTQLMDYRLYADLDLELASGAVEGAVRHVVAKRLDNGSMRWIRERAEAVLQLRCVHVNGEWDRFIDFVRARLRQRAHEELRCPRLVSTEPAPLSEDAA